MKPHTATTSPVIVRHAVADDTPELHALIAAHGAPAAPFALEALIGASQGALLVAEHAEGLVGFATLRLEQRVGLPSTGPSQVAIIEGVFVVPDHRRNGIGRAMVERARAWGHAKGAAIVDNGRAAVA